MAKKLGKTYMAVMDMNGNSILALMQKHGIRAELVSEEDAGGEEYYSAFADRRGGEWAEGSTIREAVAAVCQKNRLNTKV